MLDKKTIEQILNLMSNKIEKNKNKLILNFGKLTYTNECGECLLHIFVDDKYDEEKCYLAIKTLLESGINPNTTDVFKYNFIQTALYAGYSEQFILRIAELAFKHGLNVNHQDDDCDTVIHTAIYSDDYLGKIDDLLKLYISKGFDITLICGEARNIVEAMEFQYDKYSDEDVERIKQVYSKSNLDIKENKDKQEIQEQKINKQKDNLSKRTEIKPEIPQHIIKELEIYGKVLNNKNYLSNMAISREEEILKLMVSLAKEKSSPILIGESGVGKTAIADELVYRIKNNKIASFLQNKIVLEINPETIAQGCEYVGKFEEKMESLMKLVEQNGVILLINEIHSIYGPGTSNKNNNDFASILKKYLDRTNLKVIGTTTKEEYDKFFSTNALKRRFDTIIVNEPNENQLYEILNKVIYDYITKTNIQFEDEENISKIINILIELTNKKHRKFDDKLANPALSISIIDTSFAIAKTFDDEYIEEHHFEKAINWCERLYETSKQEAISKLKKQEKINTKILQLKK